MSQPDRHSVSVTGVVIDKDRVLVIQRRDNGAWEVPGGVLELDEPIHAGLRREVLEETGIEILPGPLTGVYKNMKAGVVTLAFRATPTGGQPTPTDESAAVEWWTVEQVRQQMVPAFVVRVLDALADNGVVPVREHDGVRLIGSGWPAAPADT
jgi:ADP-ribose pyrophosphatase YjhB (NUDIX family)